MAKIPGVPDVVNQTIGNEQYGKGDATGQTAKDNVAKLTTDAGFASSELTRAQNVIAERKKAGLDTSSQEKYLTYVSGVVAKNTPKQQIVNTEKTDAIQNVDTNNNPLGSMYTDMQGNTKAYGNAAKDSAKAALDISLQDQLTALEKTYQNAVANGEISVRDAKDAYDKQAAALNQQYYKESKNAGLYSQEMGIQNSNQSLGQQASASERNIANVNQNAMVRDKAINDIKTSLNNLRTKTDLDVNTAKANYASSLIKSNSDIDMNVLNQLNQLGMWKGDQLFQTSEREASQKFTTSERVAGQEYNTSERVAGQEYNTSERVAGQKFTAGENVLNRKFQTSERVAGEKFTAGENAANRTLQTTLQNDEQAFQASENAANRANNVKVAGINNSNKNSYQTPDAIISTLKMEGFQETKNGWTKDGKTYSSPEAAYSKTNAYKNANQNDASTASDAAYISGLASDVNDSIIKYRGDFSKINPKSKDYYTVGSMLTPFTKTPLSQKKSDVKTFNAQVDAYTKYRDSLSKSEKSKWADPPKKLTINNKGEIVNK